MGITIDEKLNWKKHINNIANKLSKVVSIIHKLKYSLTIKSLKLIYNTFFLPHLNYCNTILSTTYIYNLNRLIIIQNKSIRAIFNISNRCNTDKYYKILNILKFTDIVKLNTLKFMFRNINNCTPIIIKNMFSIKQCIYSQRHIFKFVIPFFRLNINKFCITHNGPFLWNLLENRFKLLYNINTFTRSLKYNIFRCIKCCNWFYSLFYIISYISFIYIFQLFIFFKLFLVNFIYLILFIIFYLI